MKLTLDTNVIISHFKSDEFCDETDKFFAWMKETKYKIYLSDIAYAELYTGIFLAADPKTEEKRIQNFLAVTNIEVKYSTSKIIKRAGELYAKYILKTQKELKRILPHFLIGAHAEAFSDIFITWNPADYNIKIPVKTPQEVRIKR